MSEAACQRSATRRRLETSFGPLRMRWWLDAARIWCGPSAATGSPNLRRRRMGTRVLGVALGCRQEPPCEVAGDAISISVGIVRKSKIARGPDTSAGGRQRHGARCIRSCMHQEERRMGSADLGSAVRHHGRPTARQASRLRGDQNGGVYQYIIRQCDAHVPQS